MIALCESHPPSRHVHRECALPPLQDTRFRVKEKSYGQYAQTYFVRLALMRPVLTARAEQDFPGLPGTRSRGKSRKSYCGSFVLGMCLDDICSPSFPRVCPIWGPGAGHQLL